MAVMLVSQNCEIFNFSVNICKVGMDMYNQVKCFSNLLAMNITMRWAPWKLQYFNSGL